MLSGVILAACGVTVGASARETKCIWQVEDTGVKTCVVELAAMDTLIMRCPAESLHVPTNEQMGCKKELNSLEAKCEANDEAAVGSTIPGLESMPVDLMGWKGLQFKNTQELAEDVTFYKSCSKPGFKDGYIFTIRFLKKGKAPTTSPTGGAPKGGLPSSGASPLFRDIRVAAFCLAAATAVVAMVV